LTQTAKKRGSLSVLGQYESIVGDIQNNAGMQNFWSNYQKEFDYAKEVSFDDCCEIVLKIMSAIKI